MRARARTRVCIIMYACESHTRIIIFALNSWRRYRCWPSFSRFMEDHQIFMSCKRRRFSLMRSKGCAFCIQVRLRHLDPRQQQASRIAADSPCREYANDRECYRYRVNNHKSITLPIMSGYSCPASTKRDFIASLIGPVDFIPLSLYRDSFFPLRLNFHDLPI